MSECKTVVVCCNNVGVVSLIYMGWESMCALCVYAIPILSAFFLCHPYIPLFNLFIYYLSPLFLCSVMIVGGILCCRFVHMCVFDSVVCTYNVSVPVMINL